MRKGPPEDRGTEHRELWILGLVEGELAFNVRAYSR